MDIVAIVELLTDGLRVALLIAVFICLCSKNKGAWNIAFAFMISFMGAWLATKYNSIQVLVWFMMPAFFITFMGESIASILISVLYMIRTLFVGVAIWTEIPVLYFWDINNLVFVSLQVLIALIWGVWNGGFRVRDIRANFVSNRALAYVSIAQGFRKARSIKAAIIEGYRSEK